MSLLQPFAEALFDGLRPLERALREPVYLGVLARRAGYEVRFERGALAATFGGLSTAASNASAAIVLGEAALATLADAGQPPAAKAGAVVELLDAGRALIDAIDDAKGALATTDRWACSTASGARPTATPERRPWPADFCRAAQHTLGRHAVVRAAHGSNRALCPAQRRNQDSQDEGRRAGQAPAGATPPLTLLHRGFRLVG